MKKITPAPAEIRTWFYAVKINGSCTFSLFLSRNILQILIDITDGALEARSLYGSEDNQVKVYRLCCQILLVVIYL